MKYWLVKSEPSTWSWQDHWETPEHTAEWDGVRNYQAANHMKAMSLGDLVFFYHSQRERQIVGIAEVTKEYYPDPSDPKERFGMVDLKALAALPAPVSLQQIKTDDRMQELALVRQSRLSVMPIPAQAWATICTWGEVEEFAKGKL